MIDVAIHQIAQELRLARGQVAATVGLLDDGGTVPFIARYRKEQTASLDEVAIINIRDRLARQRFQGVGCEVGEWSGILFIDAQELLAVSVLGETH